MNQPNVHRITARSERGGVLTVQCKLNNEHYRWFLVDTGAAMTAITQQTARDMGLDLTHPRRWMPIASVHKTDQVPIIQLNSFQIGGHRVNDLEIMVLSLPPNLRIDGLLGVNFLRQFRPTFEFDQAALILRSI